MASGETSNESLDGLLKSMKYADIKFAVMDIGLDTMEGTFSASRCYISSLKDVLFKPEMEADYACRWM